MSEFGKIVEAAEFALRAHSGQTRKYTSEPYIMHPTRVAWRVARLSWATRDMVIAAYLHDVVEDCNVTLEEIERLFGRDVCKLVDELTDKFTRKAYPQHSRPIRKMQEHHRLGGVSREAKAIKLADLADNLRSTDPNDGFSLVFLGETRELLSFLGWADAELREEVERAADQLRARIPA